MSACAHQSFVRKEVTIVHKMAIVHAKDALMRLAKPSGIVLTCETEESVFFIRIVVPK